MNATSLYAAIHDGRRTEPRVVTHARRFVSRARAHGVTLNPVDWTEHRTLLSWGDRVIRIDGAGHLVQSAARGDPHRAANLHRAHALHLGMAGAFRREGHKGLARQALDIAASERRDALLTPR